MMVAEKRERCLQISPVCKSVQPVSGQLLTLSQNLEKANDGLDAAIEIGDMEFLIRGVQIVVRKAHSHHDAGDFQVFLELGDDGDGAAGADVNRVFAENLMH